MLFLNYNKTILLICILGASWIGSSAILNAQQNLIPNPGFEDYSNCPQTHSNFTDFVDYWRSFHYQASFQHDCGYREPWGVTPYEGSGMVSIELFTNRFNVNWRYIQNRFTSPLQTNTLYYFEFMHFVRWEGYQIKKYQVYFSHDWYTEPYPDDQLYIELDAHFETAQEDWAPFDEWALRSGCFTVDEPYQYMMFGNFKGADTDTFTYRENALQAYIQFDNFALYEVEQLKHDDLSICPGARYDLPYFGLNGMIYTFEGDTLLDTIPHLSPGLYTIDQHLDGCGRFHSFDLEVTSCDSDCRSFPDDFSICAYEYIPTSNDYLFLHDGDTLRADDHLLAGNYLIEVADDICGVFTTFNLDVRPCHDCVDPPITDTTICVGDKVNLPEYEDIPDFRIYMDNEEIVGNSIQSEHPDHIKLTLFSDLCGWDIPADIFIDECEACDVYIPNAFTPNGDGINDVLTVHTPCDWLTYSMTIHDRWGSIIFSSDSPNYHWNGKRNNQLLDEGVYVYNLSGTMRDGLGEREVSKSGTVVLLR